MLHYDEQLERGIFMKATKKLWDISYFDRYFFAILITIELFNVIYFLGYIHISPISITIAYLPILVAGCLLGVYTIYYHWIYF